MKGLFIMSCGVVNHCLVSSLARYVGHTVTIFTESGGLSGEGFTGVLIGVDRGCFRLIHSLGMAPACPLTSFRCKGRGRPFRGNPLGSNVVIPVSAIVSFVHHSV